MRVAPSLGLVAALGGAFMWSCAESRTPGAGFDSDAGQSSSTFDGGAASCDGLTDIVHDDVPSEVVKAFDGANASEDDPPEVYEPRSKTALPADWHALHLLYRAANASYVELRLRVGDVTARYVGTSDAVSGAASDAWGTALSPHTLWSSATCLAQKNGKNIDWELRTVTDTAESPTGTAKGTIEVLPLQLDFDVTYWEVAGLTTAGAIDRMKAQSAKKQAVIDAKGGCVGCHSVTPDGNDVVFNGSVGGGTSSGGDGDGGGLPDAGGLPGSDLDGGLPPPPLDGGFPPPPPPVDGGLGDPGDGGGGGGSDGGSSGSGMKLGILHPSDKGDPQLPSYVTSAAQTALDTLGLTRPSMSRAAWSDSTGRYVAGQTGGALAVFRFDGTTDLLHVLTRTGDTTYASEPSWSPTGSFIVYTSTTEIQSGAPVGTLGSPRLMRIPIDVGAGSFGGDAVAIRGASESDTLAFHPTVSSDGQLVAFVRVDPAVKKDASYGDPAGEIWAVSAAGGTPVPLVQHDEPKITDAYQGQLTNSWPRFTQQIATVGGTTYYALAFTSRRGPGATALSLHGQLPAARMFLLFVLRDAQGQLTTRGPVLLPGQSLDRDDLTVDVNNLNLTAPAATK